MPKATQKDKKKGRCAKAKQKLRAKAREKEKKPGRCAEAKPSSRAWGHRVMPPNLAPGKDLSTPLVKGNPRIYQRLQQRMKRDLPLAETTSLFNAACRLTVSGAVPKEKNEKEIYKNVHGVRGRENDDDLHCRICLASLPKFCFCPVTATSFGKLPDVDLEHFRAFIAFVKSKHNPLMHFDEPADQVGVRSLLVKLGSDSTMELCRILYTVSMISNEAVMSEIGAEVKDKDFEYLEKLFLRRKEQGCATYRGGQRAGRIRVEELAGALQTFCDQAVALFTPYFDMWRSARCERTYCVAALRGILLHLANLELFGFGAYKKKRFAECLVLAAFGGVYNLYFKEEWLNDVADVWPLPKNSLDNLKLIFPGLAKVRNAEKQSSRACIVALLRALRHCRGYTFPSIVAQLCWWSEQRNGRINWE